jgi:hypothetical protein
LPLAHTGERKFARAEFSLFTVSPLRAASITA